MAKADADLVAARHLLAADPPLTWIVAFHAQQCAEKAIKAYLVWNQLPAPFTHNIGCLLDACGREVGTALAGAVALSRCAVTARYPLPQGDPSESEARAAVETAGKVREFIVANLRADGAIGTPTGT